MRLNRRGAVRQVLWAASVLIALPAFASGTIAEPGDVLLAEDFRAAEISARAPVPIRPGWQMVVVEGVWRRTAEGVEGIASGSTPATLALEGDFQDCVIELGFRYRRTSPDQWAACRVSATHTRLAPRTHAASAWINVDGKTRAVGLLLEHDMWDGHVTQVARASADFGADAWHQLRLELVGDRALVGCDGVTVTGKWPAFALPKNALWISSGTCPLEIRQLRIHRAHAIPTVPADPKSPAGAKR